MSRSAVSRAARRLLLVPVLSLGLGAAVLPASAESPTGSGNGHAWGKAFQGTPDFAAKPAGAGHGRKVR